MIGLDTSILVYAHRREGPWHESASRKLNALLTSTEQVALCWPVLHEFLGVVTHPRVYRTPTPMPLALEQVRWWLERPSTVLAHESSTYLDDLAALCESSGVAGPAIHDARIAAIYLGNGVREVWSADRDFSRFTSLRVINPLQDAASPEA